jgi:hypothetical protein
MNLLSRLRHDLQFTLPPAEAMPMSITIEPHMIQPLIALVAGVLILLVPRLLNYVVAVYLIAIGLLGLFH